MLPWEKQVFLAFQLCELHELQLLIHVRFTPYIVMFLEHSNTSISLSGRMRMKDLIWKKFLIMLRLTFCPMKYFAEMNLWMTQGILNS